LHRFQDSIAYFPKFRGHVTPITPIRGRWSSKDC